MFEETGITLPRDLDIHGVELPNILLHYVWDNEHKGKIWEICLSQEGHLVICMPHLLITVKLPPKLQQTEQWR